MFIVIKNFKHSGISCKIGDEYKGKDINLLLSEKLIEEKIVAKKVEPVIVEEKPIKKKVKK